MIIRNAKGEPVLLNALEQRVADSLQNQLTTNAVGYEVDITTLTTIMKRITDQKFFQIAPADYLPLRVGEGAWSAQLTTYRSFDLSDSFEKGIVNTGANSSRLASADAGVDSINVVVRNWAKTIGWSLFDLQLATKSGNWDVVSAKERSRKRNWDLGIQRIAFLGIKGDSSVLGLLTQSGVTTNTTLITKTIASMSAAELSTFLEGLVEAYRANCVRTVMPTHFIIPESDYNGLATPSSDTYPVKSKLQLLTEMFAVITQNPAFKILPLAYSDATYSDSQLSKDRYTLFNYDEESLRMDLPVDYTNTLANSIDNFSFQNVGYGQFTGVKAYRPLEMLYLDLTSS